MKSKMKYVLLLVAIGAVVMGCGPKEPKKNEGEQKPEKESKLFQLLSSEETGIDFVNHFKETDSANVITYEYIYNGSGVAAGDVNNDGLLDLYFTANMGSSKLYINKGGLKFEDVTEKAGVGTEGWCTGVTMADINNDGFLDIYVCRSNPLMPDETKSNLLFVNQQDGTFKEESKQRGISELGYSTIATFFDMENDGDLDLFIGNHPTTFGQTLKDDFAYQKMDDASSDQLYKNNGDGTFTKITDQAGVGSFSFALNVTASDFNKDGLTDIYVCNDYFYPDFLYINQGNGKFKEQRDDYIKVTATNSMGSDAADINNDGLVDFYQVDMLPEDNFRRKVLLGPSNFDFYFDRVLYGYGHQIMKNCFQLNNGEGYFSEIANYSGIECTDWSWSPLLADFDNDGWRDIYITNGYFRDITDQDFMTYQANHLSKNNREMTAAELAQQLPPRKLVNYAYKNTQGLRFQKTMKEWGLDDRTISNGSTYADLDKDGDLELIVCNLNDRAYIYENTSDRKGLTIELKGSESNKFGIGAEVIVQTKSGLEIFSENYNVRGFQSSTAPSVFVGVDAKDIESIVVKWPGGKADKVNDVTGTSISIKEEGNYSYGSDEANAGVKLFTDVTDQTLGKIRHEESGYVDFRREPLLPKMFSKRGPAMAAGDLNGDGLDDLFIGSSTVSSPVMLIQNNDGRFKEKKGPWSPRTNFEETGVLLLDVDNDEDLDLILAGGSNEFNEPNHPGYLSRLYLNDGSGNFTEIEDGFPEVYNNVASINHLDVDGDGDEDLFMAGNVIPGHYPQAMPSVFFENIDGKFTLATNKWAPNLSEDLLVNMSVFADVNGDGKKEMILAPEWKSIQIFEFKNGAYANVTSAYGLDKYTGWWNSLLLEDMDNDGDLDIVAGNHSLNSQFKTSKEKPIQVDFGDFDKNGRFDAIVSQDFLGHQAPVYAKAEMESQMKYFMSVNYKYHSEYAKATTNDLLGKTEGKEGTFTASYFENAYFENTGKGFVFRPLPEFAQLAPIFGMVATDVNQDGHMDVVCVGNAYDNKVEVGWQMASNGYVLLGDGKGNFKRGAFTGFHSPYNAKSLVGLTVDGEKTLVVGNNHEAIKAFRINSSNKVENSSILYNGYLSQHAPSFYQ
jgi:hypothetical protein